ncbi:UDP-N-acetylglucosamine 2-epimerase, partial [Ectopseudomonas oleovorans]|uniref:UDP-N-acetylglucosamine 2-epimerase n=1 Tax=Ectopseudomonas oleovorans TaxID=301 RepID=UPI001F5B904C
QSGSRSDAQFYRRGEKSDRLLGKPVLVMRDTTERPEAVEAGTVRLVGTDVAAINTAIATLITDDDAYRQMSFAHNPYGDGKACQRILESLSQLKKK